MTNRQFTQNLLYQRLRERFCQNGNVTLGERMLQASTEMKQIDASCLPENDPAFATSSDSHILSYAQKNRAVALRNFFAVFLSAIVLICFITSLFRVASTQNAENSYPSDQFHYRITTVSESTLSSANLQIRANGQSSVAENSGNLLGTAYADFAFDFND